MIESQGLLPIQTTHHGYYSTHFYNGVATDSKCFAGVASRVGPRTKRPQHGFEDISTGVTWFMRIRFNWPLSLVSTEEHDVLVRIMQGLMSGIGFVGGGAILKDDDHVRGTASAASIWVTGALGAAVGFQLWELAIALSVANFALIFTMTRIKREIK